MIPVVAVDLAEPPPANQAQAFVRACTAGLPRGRCAMDTQKLDEHEMVVALAVVHRTGTNELHIEVGAEADARAGWQSMRLQFEPGDPPVERWRTAGYAVSSLAAEATTLIATPPADETDDEALEDAPDEKLVEEQPLETEKTKDLPEERAVHRYGLWLGLTLGRAIDDGGFRGGLEGELSLRPFSVPLVFLAHAGWAGYPEDSTGLKLDWLVLGLGIGVEQPIESARLLLRAELGGRFESVYASVFTTDGSASGTHWMPGVFGGGCATYPRGARIALRGCADVLWFSGETAIEVSGARRAAVVDWNFRGALGVEVGF